MLRSGGWAMAGIRWDLYGRKYLGPKYNTAGAAAVGAVAGQAAQPKSFQDYAGTPVEDYLRSLYASQNQQQPQQASAPAPSQSSAVAPFLTPQQSIDANNFYTNQNQALIDLERNYNMMAANTREQAGQLVNGQLNNEGDIYRAQQQATQAANDALVARGLFQSSIRDGDLADIESTAANRRMSLLNALAIQSAADDRTRQNLSASAYNFNAALNLMRVQNANEVPVTPAPGASPQAPVHSDVPGLNDQQYAQQYGPGSAYQQSWEQAFRNTHGGLSPAEYDYLQALYHQQNG